MCLNRAQSHAPLINAFSIIFHGSPAIRYAREKKVPFLGICLGMQAAVIEYARSVLGISGANSKEFAPDVSDKNAAVIFMPEGSKDQLGGTMRLGSRVTILRENSLAAKLYNEKREVDERHRHRYEVNPDFIDNLEKSGLRFSGKDVRGERMEIIELEVRLRVIKYETLKNCEME